MTQKPGMKSVYTRLALCASLLIFACCVYVFYRTCILSEGEKYAERIHYGMTFADVEEVMGREPSSESGTGAFFVRVGATWNINGDVIYVQLNQEGSVKGVFFRENNSKNMREIHEGILARTLRAIGLGERLPTHSAKEMKRDKLAKEFEEFILESARAKDKE